MAGATGILCAVSGCGDATGRAAPATRAQAPSQSVPWAAGVAARPAEAARHPVPAAAQGAPATSLVAIPGGTFVMGDPAGDANEAPQTVTVAPFQLMRYEVTNRQFDRFVRETGHVTDAERSGRGSVWLVVSRRGARELRQWRTIRGASWRHPHGPRTGNAGREDHPVVQISVRDAAAFCGHYGLRLPTEAEWEFAARGLDGRRYAWGDEAPYARPGQRGNFGTEDCCAPDPSDGFWSLAPVAQFPDGASPFGLLDMTGNVWEWTASPFPGQPGKVAIRGGGWGNSLYCLRVSYRHGNPPRIGLDMVGVRCAADAAESAR
ncbi:MAG: SUMF1/EgtB/PvdO family nonheme iron enzyme [Myxococcota bacterium]